MPHDDAKALTNVISVMTTHALRESSVFASKYILFLTAMLLDLFLSLSSILIVILLVTWLFSPSASKRATRAFRKSKDVIEMDYESKKKSMRDEYEQT